MDFSISIVFPGSCYAAEKGGINDDYYLEMEDVSDEEGVDDEIRSVHNLKDLLGETGVTAFLLCGDPIHA